MQRLAITLTDDTARMRATKNALACQSRRRLEAMVCLAESELPANPKLFDGDPYALNVLNGTLDVRMRTLRAHSATDLITKLATVTYEPAAKCERWLQFVYEIMEGDAGLMDFLQRFVGLCLTGLTIERLLTICYGIGANGKTTLLNIISGLLGDYGATVDPAIFIAQSDARSASPEIVRLVGARFVAASELPEGGRLSEALLKRWTGNDKLTARALYADTIEFLPSWKLLFATNHRPLVRDDSQGFWDRLHLVPFAARFEGEKRDATLGATLICELPGILNWALDGFDRWQEHGLNRPERISSATSTYRAESDAIGSFLGERCVETSTAEVRTDALYGAFSAWSKDSGERPLTSRLFLSKMRERGFSTRKTNGKTFIVGIDLALSAEIQHFDEAGQDPFYERIGRKSDASSAEVTVLPVTLTSTPITGDLGENQLSQHLSTEDAGDGVEL